MVGVEIEFENKINKIRVICVCLLFVLNNRVYANEMSSNENNKREVNMRR